MNVLVVSAHPDPMSVCGQVVVDLRRTLTRRGHDVHVIDLHSEGFDPVMTREERVAYESDQPIIDPMVQRHADLVLSASGLVFVYPTVSGGLPAILKGWLDRVLVTGVAFRLDPKSNKVKPALGHVRRIGVVTTTAAGRTRTAAITDAGRRTLTRTLRLICHPVTRRTVRVLYRANRRSAPQQNIFRDGVEKAFGGWA